MLTSFQHEKVLLSYNTCTENDWHKVRTFEQPITLMYAPRLAALFRGPYVCILSRNELPSSYFSCSRRIALWSFTSRLLIKSKSGSGSSRSWSTSRYCKVLTVRSLASNLNVMECSRTRNSLQYLSASEQIWRSVVCLRWGSEGGEWNKKHPPLLRHARRLGSQWVLCKSLKLCSYCRPSTPGRSYPVTCKAVAV